ncbi:uncharacterized protein NPIL_697471 [Nephila pilipes]|uniref:Uncharacterized protein n=1 Tax=Nephila pilipes TaxID=299642 RepID=A0A8X6KMF7_NEPPI|nr:uncharacterized protein NPIL_697471 [Nephila pilipes]
MQLFFNSNQEGFLSYNCYRRLLGVVACDMKCMQRKLSQCFATLALRYFRNPICSAHSELDQCLKTGSQDCDMENSSTVKEVIRIYAETCTEGTPMNAMYQKHRRCVFERAAMVNGQCMRPVFREIMELGFPGQSNYEDKVLKIACKHGDSGNKCIDDGIRDICGDEAVMFRRNLSNPSIALSNEACRLVDDESNDIRDVYRHRRDISTVTEMPPHASHVAAANHHAAALYLGSTMAPNYEIMSGANVGVISQNLMYALFLIFLFKWFSPY